MKVPLTDELIDAISKLQTVFPDWRFGQLVSNLVMATGGRDAAAICELEDEQLLFVARRLVERNGARSPTGSAAAEPGH